MGAFATVDDYARRYGEPDDREQAALLLDDATALMLAAYEEVYGEYRAGDHGAFDRSAAAVCCLLVNRVLATSAEFVGAKQLSQSAIGYTVSATYGSALGEMYLGKSDLKRLGLGGQYLRCIHPKGQPCSS